MQDFALQQLLLNFQAEQQQQPCSQQPNTLWFVDENSLEALPSLAPFKTQLVLVSNRFDIAKSAKALGLHCLFNDVDFSQAGREFDHCYIRISKEKPVTHHAINQAISVLNNNGQLHLAGYKNEGIKTYAKKAAARFEHASKLAKLKDAHCLTLNKPHPNSTALETQDYTQLRTIGEWHSKPIASKPGAFGFEKIDEGSQLLLNVVTEEVQHTPKAQLDLGCGYGLLTLGTAKLGSERRVATDNNAAALTAMAANADAWQLATEIIAGDAGAEVKGYFDLIICNPPFHQGFSVSGDLTDKFLRAAHQKLTQRGTAYFVVNSFIGLEKKAERLFSNVDCRINNKQFKVIKLQK